MRHVNIPIFVTHMGCEHDCVFCNQKKIARAFPMSIEKARDIIDRAVKTLPKEGVYAEIAFFGGSFSGIDLFEQTNYLKLAKQYVDSGVVRSIRLSTRPDMIDEEILDNFKEHGVNAVELGVQSMDDEVLKMNKRGHSASDVVAAARLIKEYGFELGVQLMPGLFGDTYEKSVLSAKKAVSLLPDTARIYPTLVIKDTELCALYRAGAFVPLSLDEAVKVSAQIYLIMKSAGVTVLRMGLMANEGLNGDDLIAGPYHPAFGELVAGRVMLQKAREILNGRKAPENIVIEVKRGEVSKMTGQKRQNIDALKKEFCIKNIKVAQSDDVGDEEIRIIDA